MTDYNKLRITEKEDYWALEYLQENSDEWKELIIRPTKEEILNEFIPELDPETNEPVIDEVTGKVKTVFWPFYYDDESE